MQLCPTPNTFSLHSEEDADWDVTDGWSGSRVLTPEGHRTMMGKISWKVSERFLLGNDALFVFPELL